MIHKSLNFGKFSLELHHTPTSWWKSNTSGFLSLYTARKYLKLKQPALEMHILWCRTAIFSWNLSHEWSLALDDPFSVLFLCNLKHISFYFIQNSMKITSGSWFPLVHAILSYNDPRCFGPFTKFQHNIHISMRTVRVFRLSFRFLWLYDLTIYLIVLQLFVEEQLFII